MSSIIYGLSISVQNVLLNNVASSRDLVIQGGSLAPSTSNSNTIYQWINKTINTVSIPTWANPYLSNSFSNVQQSPIISGFDGCVVLPNGNVVLVPGISASNVYVYNPINNTFTTGPSATGYWGGVLAPNGNVILNPRGASTIGIYNYINNSLTTVNTGVTNAFIGGVLGADSNVYLAPNGVTYIGVFNTTTSTYTTFSTVPSGYNHATLLPDGRILFNPAGATGVGVFSPTTWSFTSYTSGFVGNYNSAIVLPNSSNVLLIPGNYTNFALFNWKTNTFTTIAGATVANSSYQYVGGCLNSFGDVVCAPYNATSIGIFNTKTSTFSTVSGTITNAGAAYMGCNLLPNGNIIFSPFSGNQTVGILRGGPPASADLCLHPIYNKL